MEIKWPNHASKTDLKYPQLQTYRCYRSYLRDVYAFKKSLNPAFSLRRFAQIVGFKSPNYLQLIIEQTRNLSEPMALKITTALKMSAAERDLFLALVRADNAENQSQASEAERFRLVSLKRFLNKALPSAQAQVLSRWYHLLIRELVLFPRFVPTGAWMSERLANLITPEQAEESLALLLKSGFVSLKSGAYRVTDPVLTTEDQDFHRAHMQKHHAQTLKVWSQNLERLGPLEQQLGVINIPISSEKIPELRRRIQQFEEEIIGWVQDEENADRVVQLGTYLIPFPPDEGSK